MHTYIHIYIYIYVYTHNIYIYIYIYIYIKPSRGMAPGLFIGSQRGRRVWGGGHVVRCAGLARSVVALSYGGLVGEGTDKGC